MIPVRKLLALALVTALPLSPASAQEMPKPGPQHLKLAESAGTWDATIEMMTQDGQMATSKGVSVQKVGLDGFWLIDDFTADLMGTKFLGHGMTGYDPEKGKYIGTWADSMGPTLMILEGDYDAAGKALTMTGTGPGMDGKPAKFRMVTTTKDKDTRVFEMFVTGPDGKEVKAMTITYVRRAEKPQETRRG